MAFLSSPLRLAPLERVKSTSPPFAKLLRYFPALLLGALVLIAAGLEPARAQTDSSKEYQIKAAFLYNFVQFVKWPDASFAGPDAPLSIGILGDDPFGSALDVTIQGETINNHRLTVVRSQQIEDLKNCQVIFISRSEEGYIAEILSQLGSRPVLTVSETEGFARAGGDIDFYRSGDKVRFEINPQAARQCGLRISSQLLTLGRIVTP